MNGRLSISDTVLIARIINDNVIRDWYNTE